MAKRYADLLSSYNLIQFPFVSVKLGNNTFGIMRKGNVKLGLVNTETISYPDLIQSLTISKIEGSFNTYTLTLKYPITQGSDPNFIDKIISQVGIGGKIIFSYGDLNSTVSTYTNEEAILLKSTQQFDMQSAVIQYTITASSSQQLSTNTTYNFIAKNNTKPSSIIKNIINSNSYNFKDLFPNQKTSYIADDDKPVNIEAKTGVGLLEYLRYLVSLMVSVSSGVSYKLYISSAFGESYLKVIKVNKSSTDTSLDVSYNIVIGYPSSNLVLNFSIDSDTSWAAYYNYANEVVSGQYAKKLSSDGNIQYTYSPILYTNTTTGVYNSNEEAWWNNMINYPITASLTLKGLCKPVLLASYLNIENYFFGQKHTSSGVYIVTSQQDQISAAGYTTKLGLQRVGGDI